MEHSNSRGKSRLGHSRKIVPSTGYSPGEGEVFTRAEALGEVSRPIHWLRTIRVVHASLACKWRLRSLEVQANGQITSMMEIRSRSRKSTSELPVGLTPRTSGCRPRVEARIPGSNSYPNLRLTNQTVVPVRDVKCPRDAKELYYVRVNRDQVGLLGSSNKEMPPQSSLAATFRGGPISNK